MAVYGSPLQVCDSVESGVLIVGSTPENTLLRICFTLWRANRPKDRFLISCPLLEALGDYEHVMERQLALGHFHVNIL